MRSIELGLGLVVFLGVGCADSDVSSTDAHAIVPCPGESLYQVREDVPSCSVRDVRAPTSTLPELYWGTFPSAVDPSPAGADFVVVHRVFEDPFNGGLLGTYYTLDAGCGAGGPLLNGCEFSICVDL